MVLAVALAACTNNTTVVAPVIDVPTNDSASAFPLDEITLGVAHAGSDVDVAQASFTKGQPIELAGVPFGDDLVIHMTGRIGTMDFAYGRTCAFSVNPGETPPTPHLFFSRSVHFGQLAYTPEQRVAGAAITYHDGSGLVVGGVSPADGSPIADVERLDPTTGEYRLLTSVTPRVGAVVTELGISSDAKVAVIGGLDPTTGTGAAFVELIEADNPPGRRVESIDDAQMARIGLTATPLTDGRVIAIGGSPPGGTATDTIDTVSSMSGTAVVSALRTHLTYARTDHTATRMGDDVGASVLLTGGLDAATPAAPVPTAELFKPLSGPNGSSVVPPLATMLVPRHHHTAVRLPDNSVLIIGGLDKDGNAVSTLELFTLDAGFVAVGSMPATAGLIDFSVTTLPGGGVLLTGGRLTPNGPPVDTAFIANLDKNDGSVEILGTDNLRVPRAGHQATLLCDGTVLVTGGTTDPSTAERYNPPADGRR